MRASGLFAISAVASLTFLLVRPFVVGDWRVVFEILSIVLRAVLGFRTDSLLGSLLGSALALSSVGDFLLGVRRLGSLD